MAICYGCMSDVVPGTDKRCPRCNTPVPYVPSNPKDLHPGTVLQNRFIIGRALGHGGFGITYIAYDKHLNTLRAVKEFFPNGNDCSRDTRQNMVYPPQMENRVRSAQDRFLHEARIMSIASLNHVDNVVQIIDQIEENHTAYIIMEYLQGKTLDEYLNQFPGRILPWNQAVKIMQTVLKTLEKLHKQDLLHRDISLSNIFRLNDGTIKLIDFGSSGRISMQSKKADEMSHTTKAGYSPIEQYENLEQGPWTDVYAAGATLFKLLVGALPQNTKGETLPRATKAAPNRDIPSWLDDVLIKATQKNPERRYRTAAEFEQALAKHMHSGKSKLGIIALLLLLGMLIAAGVFFIMGGQPGNENQEQPQVTATPIPTGEKEFVLNGSKEPDNDLWKMQLALLNLGYFDVIDECTYVFDANTSRALSEFCLDHNVDYDGYTLTAETRFAVHEYSKTKVVPPGIPQLTDENRKRIALLEPITAIINPKANQKGYLGKINMLQVEGTASPNRSVLVYINDMQERAYRLSVTDQGDWSCTVSVAQLIPNASNTIKVCYEGETPLDETVDFFYKPDMAEFIVDALKDGATKVSGKTDPQATVVLEINGAYRDTAKADEKGLFAFDELNISSADLVHLKATDTAGNTNEWDGSVQQVIRTDAATVEILPVPNESGYIKGTARVTVQGTASPNRQIKIIVNDTKEYPTISIADGTFVSYLNPMEDLTDEAYNVIRVEYADKIEGEEIDIGAYAAQAGFYYKASVAEIVVNNAGALNHKTTSISGTVEPAADVVLMDGIEQVAAVRTNEKGEFAFSDLSLVANRNYVLQATDIAGNVGTVPMDVLEAKREQLTIAFADYAEDYVRPVCGQDGIAICGTGEDGQSVNLVFDNHTDTTVQATIKNGQWSLVAPTDGDITNGLHTVAVEYADGKGGASGTLAFECDKQVDATTLSLVTEESISLTGQTEPNAGVVLTITDKDGSQTMPVCTADEEGNFEIGFAARAAGSTLSVVVTDIYGNVSDAVTTTVGNVQRERIRLAEDIPQLINGSATELVLKGTASADKELLVTINDNQTKKTTIDAKGNWSVSISTAYLIDGEENHFLITYADQKGVDTEAEYDCEYDATIGALELTGVSYQDEEPVLYADTRSITGTCDRDVTVTLMKNGTVLATDETSSSGKFELELKKALVVGDDLKLVAKDEAGNTTELSLSVVAALNKYLGDIKLRYQTFTGDLQVSKAWAVCANGYSAKVVILSPDGNEVQTTKLREVSSDKTRQQYIDDYGSTVQADLVYEHKNIQLSMTDFETDEPLPSGTYTVKLLAIDDSTGVEYEVVSAQAVYEPSEEAAADEAISFGEYHESDLFVFGMDHLSTTTFHPSTVCFTGGLYAPAGTAITMNYVIDGTSYSESAPKQMRSALGGTPESYLGYRSSPKAAYLDEKDLDKAGLVFCINLTKLPPGRHTIKIKPAINIPEQGMVMLEFEEIIIYTSENTEKLDPKALSNQWKVQ